MAAQPDDMTFPHAPEPAVLGARRVRLRPWRTGDARWVQEPDDASRLIVTDMQPTPGTFDDWLRHRRARMAGGALVFWCVADRETDEPLGYIHLDHLDVPYTRGNGELGYWLFPQARGRGLMAEAIEVVRRHAFAARDDGGLGLRRLQAGTYLHNTASARALRRAGFRMWGQERAVLAHQDGPAADALNWELLATDDIAAQRVSPSVIPTLDVDGIRLRPWRDDDVAHLPDEVDETSKRFMPEGAQVTRTSFPGWLDRQRRYADEGSAVPWCIADAATDEPLGDVAIFNIGEGTATSAELGYWLLPAARGRGVLSRVLEVVVAQAFSPPEAGGYGLTRLHAATDLENHASQALLRGVGMRKWGEDRQAYTAAGGRITDGAYFELLATDDREAQRVLKPPVLDFPDVRLRPLQPADAAALARTWAEPDVRQWLSVPQHDLERRASDYIARKRYADNAEHGSWWTICRAAGDDFAGVIGLQNLDGGNAEVGYWLSAQARDRGLATHALNAVTSYAFMPVARGGLGMRRLHIGIAEGNDRSAAVALRAGYREFGRARLAEELGDGTVVDLHLYERLSDD